jgi:hypothetical protein
MFVGERQRAGHVPHRSQAPGDPELWARATQAGRPASWTPGDSVFTKMRAAWRAHGPRWLIEQAVRRLRVLVWDEALTIEWLFPIASLKLIEPPRVPRQPGIRVLAPGELSQLRPCTSRSQYRLFKRLAASGCECFVAELDGQIVGYNWYTDRTYRTASTGLEFAVGPQERFLIYSHTLRAWRGRGIDPVIKAVAFRRYQEAGVQSVRTAIDDTNRASIRVASRWHGRPVRQYRYRRVLWWRRAQSEPITSTPELVAQLAGRTPRSHVALNRSMEVSAHGED